MNKTFNNLNKPQISFTKKKIVDSKFSLLEKENCPPISDNNPFNKKKRNSNFFN